MGSFDVLDLGLFGGKANMCWNFNGCGDFCGGDFGGGDKGFGVRIGSIKVAQKVGIVGVLSGRAWVSSLPNFFPVNSFQFWKLPPGFCINSMSNVYYPIFLSCYLVIKTNIEYTVICIIDECLSVRIVS